MVRKAIRSTVVTCTGIALTAVHADRDMEIIMNGSVRREREREGCKLLLVSWDEEQEIHDAQTYSLTHSVM